MSKKFQLGDKEKLISRVLECRHVGIEFYDKAFFDFPLQELKSELKTMVNT